MPTDTLSDAQARLNRARDKQRRAQMGAPLNVDDASLDVLAEVYPVDLLAAETLIRDAAGALGVDLFNATIDGLDGQPAGRV
jgi:hypothetical protein